MQTVLLEFPLGGSYSYEVQMARDSGQRPPTPLRVIKPEDESPKTIAVNFAKFHLSGPISLCDYILLLYAFESDVIYCVA